MYVEFYMKVLSDPNGTKRQNDLKLDFYRRLCNTQDNFGFLKKCCILVELWPQNCEKMHFNDIFIWNHRFSNRSSEHFLTKSSMT